MTITTKLTIADKAVDTIYQDATGTTSGSGTGAKFDVTKTNGAYTVKLDSATASSGTGYVAGDTITIAGTSLGGTSTNNLIVTVATVGTNGKIATFGAVGTGRVGDGDIDVMFEATGSNAKAEVFSLEGKIADFTVNVAETGLVTVTHPDLDNVELTLKDIERLSFTDKSLAFDVEGRAGEVYAILCAALGQDDVTPELMGEYLVLADAGLTDTQIANALIYSKTYEEDALGLGNETFVKHIWKNVTGELPSLENLKFFTKILDDKVYAKADLLEIASNLTLFRDEDHIDLVGMTKIEYVPYSV